MAGIIGFFPNAMDTHALDYDLPEHLVAAVPADRREAARLMVVHRRGSEAVTHCTVADLPRCLRPGDLLVLNRTQVIPARFDATRRATGGRVHGLYLGSDGQGRWQMMVESRGRLQVGESLDLGEGQGLVLEERQGGGLWLARRTGQMESLALLERIGAMPLPPYIRRARRRRGLSDRQLEELDRRRYQTVYADQPGAVAAPTAGLHLTETLLERLAQAGIRTAMLTLHVGLGTFAPVRSERLEDHPMHSEWFCVPSQTLAALKRARAEGRRIVAVGTTCVRALESLPHPLPEQDYAGWTDLLIQPGFTFRYTDALMTNFHLPRSTLLALVGALVGLDRLKRWYALAIEQGYRFYSYGDAMLILP